MSTWKPVPLERTTLGPVNISGFDSIQGYLELALWYDHERVIFNCDPRDKDVFNSMYFHLCRLEAEGFLVLEWTPQTTSSGEDLLELKQLALTTSGQQLLAELRSRSRWGKVKDRITTILWAVISAIVTTLAVLAVKGG